MQERSYTDAKKRSKRGFWSLSVMATAVILTLLVGDKTLERNQEMIDRSGTHPGTKSISTSEDISTKISLQVGPCRITFSPDEKPSPGFYIQQWSGREMMHLVKLDLNSRKMLWTLNTSPYTSYPSVNVVGDTIFISLTSPFFADNLAPGAKRQHVVSAIDARNGKLRWKTDLSTSSPQSDNDAIILTGPTVVNGLVYVGQSNGILTALSAATGEQCWQYDANVKGNPINSCAGWMSPGPFVVDKDVVYGVLSQVYFAVDSKTGRELWKKQIKNGHTFTSLFAANDRLYLSSDDDFCHFPHSNYVYAFDPANGNEIWKHSFTDEAGINVTVAHDAIYVSGFNGSLYRLDAEKGEEQWKREGDEGVVVGYPPVVTEEALYIAGSNIEKPGNKGVYYSLDPINGQINWSRELDDGGGIYGVVGETMYVRVSPLTIVALNIKDGSPGWKQRFGQPYMNDGVESSIDPTVTIVE